MAGLRGTAFFVALPIIVLGIWLSRAPFMMTSTAPSEPWADAPMALITTPQYQTKQTDIFTIGATHMALLHNTIFRGFNAIYQQAPRVKDKDKADFVGYSLTWHKFVKSHHDDEEQELFTKVEDLLKDKTIFEETHKEHEAFLGGLAEFEKYLRGLASPAAFSGPQLVAIMDGFREPFETHFHNEIATIAAFRVHVNAPKPGTPENDAASAVFKNWGKDTVTKAGLVDVVPFFLVNLDRTVEDGMWVNWPPIPGPVKWVLLNVVGPWHSGWWKFAACDANGQPKQLYALAA